MKKLYLGILLLSLEAMAGSRAHVQVGINEGYGGGGYYQPMWYGPPPPPMWYGPVWYGPGMYNGVWFSSQVDFDRHHHHYHHHHH